MIKKHSDKIFKYIKRILNFFFEILKTRPLCSFYADDFQEKRKFDLIVVAFNDLKLIETQYFYMQKNLNPNEYHYIICDNSNKKDISTSIENFCRTHGITYFRLPKFFYVDPSRSHGYALNWIYRHIISNRKNDFAFIDHDIFPIKHIMLENYAHTPLCGVRRERHGYWYPWAAFSFYSFDFLKSKKVNFMPCRYNRKHLDTGGGNYKEIYTNILPNQWCELTEKYINAADGSDFEWDKLKYKNFDDAAYENAVELIDKRWLHIIGGAQWGGKHNKFALAMKLVGDLERE